MTGLLALRVIDVAIFGSLGGLWILGAILIALLYRWILRFEASVEPRATAFAPISRKTTGVPDRALSLTS